ncbi:MAG: cyclic nucleotide-binding domain-containing protein [Treponema sp.]|jgi:CRP-like cAMP-binding protein|nr:cyclic nucleotide-binding domain-containing protein [Treponema sp.]
MPKTLQYQPKSVIYFQGDSADKIFLLQKGTVNIAYQEIETGKDIHEKVQAGEFFGVKSALGKYPREETAIVINESTLMVFTVPEFEQMASANTRIVLKMLKVFSTQMRRVHKQLSGLTDSGARNPEIGLFHLGEYYIKNKRFSEARYVCSRYLTYYPAGQFADKASKYLEAAEIYLKKYGRATPAAAADGKPADNAGAYARASSAFSQKKYQEAFAAFKKIAAAASDSEYASKSSFDMGRCIFFMGKYEECIKYYTQLLVKHPKHPRMGDILFFMGQCYEKMNQRKQAALLYKKAAALSGNSNSDARARAEKALAVMGV